MPRPSVEHRKQPGKVNHGRSIGSGAALKVAVVAGKLVSHVVARIFWSLIKDQFSLMNQFRLLPARESCLLRICRSRPGCLDGTTRTAENDQANKYERRSGNG
jgi:hypothetical protein